ECCSLDPQEERLALSFFLTIEPSGEVLSFEYYPSVVRVNQQFTFSEVQSLLSDPEQIPAHFANYTDSLHQLFFILSPLIKGQRLQRGSFNLQSDSPIAFYDEGRLGVILVNEQLPVRALLTELVVLVGKSVANHLAALELPAIYCTQSPPEWEDLTDILKLANNLGLEILPDPEAEITPQDFARLSLVFSKSPSVRILNHLLEGSLKIAKYSTHPAPHFGLAYDSYTHYISPGQRYADLLVQRVLKAVLSEGRDRRTKQTKIGVDLASSDCYGQITWNVLPPTLHETLVEDFHHLVTALNDREKTAEDAERDLIGLKKAEKMKARTGQIFRGLITGVQSYGFFVEIDDLLVEGLVHVSSLKDDWYEYRSRHSCLVGRKNRTAFRLGNEVDVQVKSVDYYRQQIDLITIGGGAIASKEDLEDD
ncbi:MAG: RNB domain-containing ribonuclease, partial [Microcystaceae cyanobacterium]